MHSFIFILIDYIKNESPNDCRYGHQRGTYYTTSQRRKVSRTIRRFKERRVKGHQIYSKNGRPPSIDQISEEAICDWINENPHFDRTMLQVVIKQECKETFMRKHPLYVANDRRKKTFSTRHTIYRWYRYFTVFKGILF